MKDIIVMKSKSHGKENRGRLHLLIKTIFDKETWREGSLEKTLRVRKKMVKY